MADARVGNALGNERSREVVASICAVPGIACESRLVISEQNKDRKRTERTMAFDVFEFDGGNAVLVALPPGGVWMIAESGAVQPESGVSRNLLQDALLKSVARHTAEIWDKVGSCPSMWLIEDTYSLVWVPLEGNLEYVEAFLTQRLEPFEYEPLRWFLEEEACGLSTGEGTPEALRLSVAEGVVSGALLLVVRGRIARAFMGDVREERPGEVLVPAALPLLEERRLENPRWEHVDEVLQEAEPDRARVADWVVLYADASGYAEHEFFWFEMYDGPSATGEPLAKVPATLESGVVQSEKCQIPSLPSDETLVGVTLYFRATRGREATELAPIDIIPGLQLLYEVDLDGVPHDDDVLVLLDEQGQTVQEIVVGEAEDGPPGFKSLYLPGLEPGRGYSLIRRYESAEEGGEDPLFLDHTPEDVLAYGFDPPRLLRFVLLNGVIDPDAYLAWWEEADKNEGEWPAPIAEEALRPQSLAPVSNRFFLVASSGSSGTAGTTSPGSSRTLLVADEQGCLRSVDSKLRPAPFDLVRLAGSGPLTLEPLAAGMVRTKFFADKASWQRTLVEEAAGLEETPFKAVPIFYRREHLEPIDPLKYDPETLEALERLERYAAGATRLGYLFPKTQYVFLLVPDSVVDESQRKDPVPALRWWSAKEDESSAVEVPGQWISLSYGAELGQSQVDREFALYLVTSAHCILTNDEVYRIRLPLSLFYPAIREWAHDMGLDDGLLLSYQVKFEISTLMSDIDYQVIAPISIEEALIAAYPDRLAAVMHRVLQEQKSTPNPVAPGTVDPVKAWSDRMSLMRTRQQLALGVLSADTHALVSVFEASGRKQNREQDKKDKKDRKNDENKKAEIKERRMAIAQAFGQTLSFASMTVSEIALEGEAVAKWFALADKAYAAVLTMLDIHSKWRGLPRMVNNMERSRFVWQNVRRIYDLADGPAVSRLFTAWSWNKWALTELREKKVPEEFALQLGRLTDDEQLGKMIKEGIPTDKEFSIPESSSSSVIGKVGKGLEVLDTALAVYAVYQTWNEARQSSNSLQLHMDRLSAMTRSLPDRWHLPGGVVAPEWGRLEEFEAERFLVYSLRMNLSQKEWQLVKEAVSFTVQALTWVPVVGELAHLVLLLQSGFVAGMEALALLVQMVDSAVLENRISVWWTGIRKWYALQKLHGVAQWILSRYVFSSGSVQRARLGDDPMVQLLVRERILSGLLGLIDRCGSRFGDPEAFERKVRQYKIKEYIEFWLSPGSEVRYLVVESVTVDPTAQWLYAVGAAEARFQDRTVVDQAREGNSWESTISTYPGIWNAAFYGLRVAKIPVTFHRWFPIHHMISGDVVELARTLCTDYSAVTAGDIVFARVYVWHDGWWCPVDKVSTEDEKKRPRPTSPIRVVVVFERNPSLAGLPVSLQLVRNDTWPATRGPVYKTSLRPLKRSEAKKGESTGGHGGTSGTDKEKIAAAVMDDGLLQGTEEEAYFPVQDSKTGDAQYHMGLVFYPFYHFHGELVHGAKPCGHVPLLPNAEMSVAFRLKVGPRSFWVGQNGDADVLRVLLTGSTQSASAMTLDREFLASKSSLKETGSVYANQVQVVAALLKRGQSWRLFTSGTEVVGADEFDFDWTRPFEMVFLFSVDSFGNTWANVSDRNLDGYVQPYEVVVGFDKPGPQYGARGRPLELTSELETTKDSKRAFFVFEGELEVGALRAMLVQGGVLSPEEDVEPTVDGKPWTDPPPLHRQWHVGAVRVKFAYSIQRQNGKVDVFNAFKPFGTRARRTGDSPYVYRMALKLANGSTFVDAESPCAIELPCLPPAKSARKGWEHLGKDRFVDEESLWQLLALHETDFSD